MTIYKLPPEMPDEVLVNVRSDVHFPEHCTASLVRVHSYATDAKYRIQAMGDDGRYEPATFYDAGDLVRFCLAAIAQVSMDTRQSRELMANLITKMFEAVHP